MSPARSAVCCLALVVFAAHSAAAQSTPDSTTRRDTISLDSLNARLQRAEAAIALLREELAGESESAVHTRSRLRVDLSAQVLTNAFITRGRTNSEDVPLLVLPPVTAASVPPNHAMGATVRQTRFGLATSVTDVLGGTFSGDVDMDLFAGDAYSAGDRPLFPEPRLRTVEGRIIWTRTELMFGSEAPLISGLNPVSLAAVGSPEYSAAGNLWNWLPQVRVSQEIGATSIGGAAIRWAVQGAVMTPYSNQLAAGEPDAVDAGDRSLRPAFEARLRARWGDEAVDGTVSDAVIAPSGGEVGVGMHRAWIETAAGTLVESHAVSLDAHAVIAPGLELRGEGYAGRLLRGLGGGGIGQNFGAAPAGAPANTLGPPVRDVAGWAQLNVQPNPVLLGSAGCGVDIANAADRPTRRQNTVCSASAAWRPVQPLLFALTYRQFGTRYSTGTYGARQFNLALGFEL